MPSLISRLLAPRLLRPLFWALALFALVMALLPKPPTLPIDKLGDKFEHMLAFGVLAGVARIAWRRLSLLTLMARLSAFGALIEVLQAIPLLHRDSDVRDWLADSAAIVLCGLIAQFLLPLLARNDAS